jgi:hypothetical protein
MGNIVNRVFDSSGPESKVRGTPQQIIDKYNQLARDAQLSNDRVAAENFQQHAEHYTRMLGEALREQESFRQQNEGRPQHDRPQGGDDRGGDHAPRDHRREDDRGDRGEQPRYDQPRHEEPRDGGDRRRGDDVIDVSDEDAGTLVETPESAAEAPAEEPARPPRRRRPRKASGDGAEAAPDVKPEAAE